MHVHVLKAGAECKYWLHADSFDITEELAYNMTPRLKREIRQIIFQHFDQLVAAWREYFGEGYAD